MKKLIYLALLATGAVNAQISSFPAAAPLDGSELVLVEQTATLAHVTVEDLAAYSNSSGEFDVTFNVGYTTPATVTFRWARSGNTVTLRLTDTITGTSNATNLTTGEKAIPTDLAPPTTINFMGIAGMDNGVLVPVCLRIDAGGWVWVGRETSGGACNTNGFTIGGTKQVRLTGNTTWTYTLN